MQVQKIMTTDVATARPDTNLAAISKLMWDRDCGFVPVIDAAGKVSGVISDRDICIASATRRLLPEQITAAQAIGRVTGAVGVEDILDRIFAEFCIGK